MTPRKFTFAMFLHLLVPGYAAIADPSCIDWTIRTYIPPSVRFGTSLAYDSVRGVIVLFGGKSGTNTYFNDTWEWNGTTWKQCGAINSPPARYGHAMTFDSVRGVTVLFGGERDGLFGDTWEWNGVNWMQRSPATNPPARRDHAITFDSGRGVTVLFGGYPSGLTSDATWEWNGTNWTQRNPANKPPARWDHAMAYDSKRGVSVLFGGYIHPLVPYFRDTWEWDGTNWTQRGAVISPPARSSHALAYDSIRGVILLFGGRNGSSNLGDTWEWDGANWLQRNSTTNPDGRSAHALAFDALRGTAVMFGGILDAPNYFGSTWEWNGVTWARVTPPSRYGHAMAYDSTRAITVMFGGNNASLTPNDTQEWNGNAWTQRTPINSPSAREGHAVVFDSSRSMTVLFGGLDNYEFYDYLAETWEWDGTNWTMRVPPTTPSARSGHAMAYDIARGVTILFGGVGNDGLLGDTWEWDGATWTQHSPKIHPTVRSGHSIAYDSARCVSVLFGGNSLTGILDDTWEWDGSTWIQLVPSTSPPARSFHAMVYDSNRGVTVLSGGNNEQISPYYFGDTWEWNGTTWIQHSSLTSPAARYHLAMAYDSARNVTVLFAGFSSTLGDSLGDTWELGASNPDADMNISGNADGLDISLFVEALLSASTEVADLFHADSNCNGVIDEGDLAGFTQKLLGL